MAFSRQMLPREFSRDNLVPSLVSIGLNLGSKPSKNPVNIEDVLFFSSLDSITNSDFRVLSILTTWLEVHHLVVNVDRLQSLVISNPTPKFRAYWASIANWLSSDHRFAKIKHLYKG